jgi:hypothetical protein
MQRTGDAGQVVAEIDVPVWLAREQNQGECQHACNQRTCSSYALHGSSHALP